MKIKNCFLTAIAALGVIFTSCTKEDELSGIEKGEGVITVKLSNSGSARSTTQISPEDGINNYKVYVFAWNSGALEVAVDGDPSKTTTISGLTTATTKRVLVLTNLKEKDAQGNGNYPDVKNYAELEKALIDLDVQDPEVVQADGYIMRGVSSNAVTLVPEGKVTENIGLERIVAKISLGSVTLSPEEGYDMDKFELLGVSVQRVIPLVSLSPVMSFYKEGGQHYGGFVSEDVRMIEKNYLKDELDLTNPYEINNPYKFSNYFLVFPNGDKDNCTLLTLHAKYDDKDIYFPIRVNYEERTGENATDGSFVEHNKHYTLNITLKKIGDGTVDPQVPPKEGNLDVLVTVEDWTPIVQNEEW